MTAVTPSEIDAAAKSLWLARERLAVAAVAELFRTLKRKGSCLADDKAVERATERIVETLIAEGCV